MKTVLLPMVALSLSLLGCPAENAPVDDDDDDDVDVEGAAVRLGVKNFVNGELTLLNDSAATLQSFTASPDANGWNVDDDAASVITMKQQWKNARLSSERVQGVIAALFPALDRATGGRWDGFIDEAADDNVFDDAGVTGVHGVERILFSDEVPADVLAFEQAHGDSFVPSRFTAPAFPASLTQAEDFKGKLVQRLVDDTATMKEEFLGVDLTLEAAFGAVLASLQAQAAKVNVAGAGQDESRYAQHTLADMRANLEGGLAIYEAFDALFDARGDEGEALHDEIHEAFQRVRAHYDGITGDALPLVPATWNPAQPSEADLATEYGALFLFLTKETDVDDDTSFVSALQRGAALLELTVPAE